MASQMDEEKPKANEGWVAHQIVAHDEPGADRLVTLAERHADGDEVGNRRARRLPGEVLDQRPGQEEAGKIGLACCLFAVGPEHHPLDQGVES